ncbi:MAG: polyribonucleotide nucleotidyltransferase, partial [Bdellovibrionales bacterium]
MNPTTVKAMVGNNEITIETGKLAKQADGSVVVSCGNNVVLVTVVSSRRESTLDFFPLTVEYQERMYAAGKIPGGFFKREGRPSADGILICRLIDRPLRPKFPEGYRQETQVVATVLSSDGTFPLGVLSGIGASTATHISDIPFDGPVGFIEVGRVDGSFVSNPNEEQKEQSDMEFFIGATPEGILMVEGESKFVSEADVLSSIKFAHTELKGLFAAQNELREKVGKTKREFSLPEYDADFKQKAEDYLTPKIKAALAITEKMARYQAVDDAKAEATSALLADISEDKYDSYKKDLGQIVGDVKYNVARSMAVDEGKRIDGRDFTTVRPIWTEASVLPRAHGSSVFTRGETQVLGVVTLGT